MEENGKCSRDFPAFHSAQQDNVRCTESFHTFLNARRRQRLGAFMYMHTSIRDQQNTTRERNFCILQLGRSKFWWDFLPRLLDPARRRILISVHAAVYARQRRREMQFRLCETRRDISMTQPDLRAQSKSDKSEQFSIRAPLRWRQDCWDCWETSANQTRQQQSFLFPSNCSRSAYRVFSTYLMMRRDRNQKFNVRDSLTHCDYLCRIRVALRHFPPIIAANWRW